MALKAMEAICLAEENAKRQKDEALAKAKQGVAQAEEKGRAELAAIADRVAAELKEKKAQAHTQAEKEAKALFELAAKEKEELWKKAESRIPQAADYIVERIVNG